MEFENYEKHANNSPRAGAHSNVNRAALKELHSNEEINVLSVKPATENDTKLPPTLRATLTPSKDLTSVSLLSNPETAAGSATANQKPENNIFCISESKETLGETRMAIPSSTFAGLPECSVNDFFPELTPELEEQLKVDLDEQFLQTFSTSTNMKKSDDIDTNYLFVSGNDTDTAVSSDNEIFVDALSSTQDNTLETGNLYISAVNTYNSSATIVNNVALMNTTIENVRNMPDDIATLPMQQPPTAANTSFEPMDVDLSMSEVIQNYSKNETLEAEYALQMKPNDVSSETDSNKTEILEKEFEVGFANQTDIINTSEIPNESNTTGTVMPFNVKNDISNEKNVEEELGKLENKEGHNRLTYLVSTNEKDLSECSNAAIKAPVESNIECAVTTVNSTNEDIEHNQSNRLTFSVSNTENNQEVGTSQGNFNSNLILNTTSTLCNENDSHDSLSKSLNSTVEMKDIIKNNEESLKESLSKTKSFPDLNVTVDMNLSVASFKSNSSLSPSFPIKTAVTMTQFPRSPTAIIEKEMPFLETSEYTERERKKSMGSRKSSVSEVKITASPQRKISQSNNNTSFDKKMSASPIAMESILNSTFEGANENASIDPSADLQRTTKDKRRTFNIDNICDKNQQKDILMPMQSVTNLIQADKEKRRTFNPTSSDQLSPKKCIEPFMDIDSPDSLLTTVTSQEKKDTPKPTEMCRRPIHSPENPFNISIENTEPLSAKEKNKSSAEDEREERAAKNSIDSLDDMFEKFTCLGADNGVTDPPFETNLILNPSDFDYLLKKGNNHVQVDRNSLLMRFDPLLGVPVPVNQQQQIPQNIQQLLGLGASNNSTPLGPTIEEDEQAAELQQLSLESVAASLSAKSEELTVKEEQQLRNAETQKNARMSADVIKDLSIEQDSNKTFDPSNLQSKEKQINYIMDEPEKKIKNKSPKTEELEKKLQESEQREEALIKRITEKDKAMSKMNSVIESYEKTIAELVREKEQNIQNYEKQLAELKADRDTFYHHLTSLESTFSDLHAKYEKSKEMTMQLKTNEEALLTEKKQNREHLRLQEQRYEKMKSHAMQQLEIANKKLESLTKEHAIESTKVKALLKKEEIAKASMSEQLQQKTRENAELVKICDELINGQGS